MLFVLAEEFCLQLIPEYVLSKNEINFVAIGEGEITLLEVAESVRTTKNLKNILGTWYKNDDGTIIKNKPNKLVDINNSKPRFFPF